ncbi:hypothetical protein Tco_1486059 [Tanacetum coccineum]
MWCCYDDDDDELMMMMVMTAETAGGGRGKMARGGEWGSGLGRSEEEEHICSGNLKMSGNEDHHHQGRRFAAGGNGHDGRNPRDVEIERLH